MHRRKQALMSQLMHQEPPSFFSIAHSKRMSTVQLINSISDGRYDIAQKMIQSTKFPEWVYYHVINQLLLNAFFDRHFDNESVDRVLNQLITVRPKHSVLIIGSLITRELSNTQPNDGGSAGRVNYVLSRVVGKLGQSIEPFEHHIVHEPVELSQAQEPPSLFNALLDVFRNDAYHKNANINTRSQSHRVFSDGLKIGEYPLQCQRVILTSARSVTFPSGLIMFHGGAIDRNQFRTGKCCFFASLTMTEAAFYTTSSNRQHYGNDPALKDVELRAYQLLAPVTLYEWYFKDLMALWVGDDGDDQKAEYEANNTFEKVGLDGKFSSDSTEVMFTTKSVKKLKELSVDLGRALFTLTQFKDETNPIEVVRTLSDGDRRIVVEYLFMCAVFFFSGSPMYEKHYNVHMMLARHYYPSEWTDAKRTAIRKRIE